MTAQAALIATLVASSAGASSLLVEPVVLLTEGDLRPAVLQDDLSGATWFEDTLFLVRNRARDYHVYRVDTAAEWRLDGAWRVAGYRRPDIEAITEVPGAGLLLAEERGTLLLVSAGSDTEELDVVERWDIRGVSGHNRGIEALTWVPEAKAVEWGAPPGALMYAVMGDQRTGELRLLALPRDASEPVSPVAAIRVHWQGRPFDEIAGLFWDGQSLWSWHNEARGHRCENTLVQLDAWTEGGEGVAAITPELAGVTSRCPNFEGVALSTCTDGARTLVLTLDTPDADAGEHYLYRGQLACP